MQWNINRWYDANVGRWISEDPIGFQAKDANLARYVGNSPEIYADPKGLDACCPQRNNPARGHSACCSKFERFYAVFPGGDDARLRCINSLLDGTWPGVFGNALLSVGASTLTGILLLPCGKEVGVIGGAVVCLLAAAAQDGSGNMQ